MMGRRPAKEKTVKPEQTEPELKEQNGRNPKLIPGFLVEVVDEKDPSRKQRWVLIH